MPRALVIPGVQDMPEDWENLQQQLGEDLSLVHAKRPPFDKRFKTNPDEWLRILDSHYLEQAQQQECDILIAHSFGSRIAIDTLLQTQNIKGGILIAPGRNGIDMSAATEARSFTEMMIKPITYAMEPEVYENFLHRHELNDEQVEVKNRMRAELGLIKNGPPLSYFLDRLNGTPLLVVRAPRDPWDIKELDEIQSASIQINAIEDADHYPHVSRTQQVAQHIRAWVREIGLSIDTCVAAPASAVTAQATAQA